MRGLIVFGNWLWKAFWAYQTFLPMVFAGIVVLFKFISILVSQGGIQAVTYLGTQLFAAEWIIRQNTMLAIQDSPQYGLGEFLQIISSLILIFYIVKILTAVMVNFAGAQAKWSASILSLFVMALLEMVVIKVTQNTFSFIPIKDGLWFAAMNLSPILHNIHLLGFLLEQGGNITLNSTQNMSEMLSAGNITMN